MLKSLRSENPQLGLFLLRVGIGLSMLSHGLPKLLGFAEKSQGFADPLGLGPVLSLSLAIFAEVICSILLILGIKVRWATIPLLTTMLVAFFIVHGQDPWGRKELSAIYGLVYITLLLAGGGSYQVRR